MTTRYRSKSSLDVYHVIIKGSRGHSLFEDDSDRMFFLKLLRKYATELDGEIFAWTLMSNHAHLILHMPLADIATLQRKLGPTYFRHFNDKSEAAGPVLQNRYHSKAINTNEYLMTCVRYVHQNIEKAGVHPMEDYRWSSYLDYLDRRQSQPFDITDTDFVMSVFESVRDFARFHQTRDYAARCIDIGKTGQRLDDDEARILAKHLLGEEEFHHIGEFDRPTRNKKLRLLRDNGLSISQINRLTGIGAGIIARV